MSAAPAPRLAGALLFVPADARRLAKLAALDADGFVVDLEDAIHPDAKGAARALAAEAIAGLTAGGESEAPAGPAGGRPLLVRINPLGEGGEEDLEALAGARPGGVVVPKASAAGLRAAAAAVAGTWGAAAPPLVALVESALGVLQLEAMLDAAVAEGAAVAGIALGAEDLAADLGVSRSAAGSEVELPRRLIALHAHARGIAAIDSPFLGTADEAGLARDVAAAAQLGYAGKLCIHPNQVEIVRAGLAPSPEQLDWARRALAAAAESERRGEAVALLDGRMLDPPVLAQARRLLDRAS